MKRLRWLGVVALIGGAITCYETVPPGPQSLTPSSALPVPVRGAIHVHTRRSDGTGTVDEVAGAAARAGLNFVILTDHGNGTREPEAPTYRRGVLCIDAVEISTDGGHIVALGLPRSPYPLGGEARDVVDDVRRLGGMAIAAHPSSPREELRWADWNTPLDGLEWLNGDSEWRDEPLRTLARALLTYPFRRAETLATLLDRSQQTLQRWDGLVAQRRIVAVAASDAHARIGLRGTGDPYNDGFSLHIPSYEQVFRTFSIALPQVMLRRVDPSADARAVLDAIRHGHVFSSIDALAAPVSMSFWASSGNVRAEMGDVLRLSGPLVFHVETNSPPDATIFLMRDGRAVKTVTATALDYAGTETGVYRVEIQLPRAPGEPPVPWVVSNPVYVLPRVEAGETATPVPAATGFDPYDEGPAGRWRVENSPRSQGVLDVVPAVGGTQLSVRYALGGTASEGPFVALVMPVPAGFAGYDRLMFTARASRPMRLSIQLRVPEGQRWHRSVYLDESARTITVTFDDMMPRGATTSQRPLLSAVGDVLFVTDTVNTPPGASGQWWLDEVKFGR